MNVKKRFNRVGTRRETYPLSSVLRVAAAKTLLNLRAIDAPSESAMSIKRLHAGIPAEESLIEFLVGLQLDESLSSAPTPDWARGTSVEEIFGALRLLGDGEWLVGFYEGCGSYESADRWLNDFFQGREVPTPSDLRH
jgi:hypothetical protein